MNINLDQLVEIAQKEILVNSGFVDTFKPFSVAVDGTAIFNDNVLVPVFSTTSASYTSGTAQDFQSEEGDSVQLVQVKLAEQSKKQDNLRSWQYENLSKYAPTIIKSLINKIGFDVSSRVYAKVTSANFPGTVSVSWNEAAPTITSIMSLVGKAKATGKLDPSAIKIVMPSLTYAIAQAQFMGTARDVIQNLGFDIVESTNISKTFVTDGSGLSVAWGRDTGVGNFEYIPATEGQIGYGIRTIENADLDMVKIALRTTFGSAVTNTNGILWAA